MQKLLHALNRPSVQRFMNNLKKITINKNINDKLKDLSNKNNIKNDKEKLGRYLNKLKNIRNAFKQKENDSASMIQRAFLILKARTERKNLLSKKTLLIKYVIQKYYITNNKLYIYI